MGFTAGPFPVEATWYPVVGDGQSSTDVLTFGSLDFGSSIRDGSTAAFAANTCSLNGGAITGGADVDAQRPPGGDYSDHGQYASCVAQAAEARLCDGELPLRGGSELNRQPASTQQRLQEE